MHSSEAHLPELAASLVIAAPAVEFAAIYDAWFHEVERWVRALGGPDADREDIAQEVFIAVQRTLPRFDGRNLPGWLYRITTRAVRDHRRRAWFRKLFLRQRDVDLDAFEHRDPNPAAMLERREAERELRGLLDELSEIRRSTFVLFEIEGYSGEEIAGLHSVPVATVWTRLHHARKELAERLAARHSKGRM